MQIENAYRDSVRERDLDNFLVEELSASSEFREWVLGKVTAAFIVPQDTEVRVRKSPPRNSNDGRQTDVQLGWFSGEILRSCVSGGCGPRTAYLDGVKFHGSRSSRRLCAWPLAMAVRVALR